MGHPARRSLAATVNLKKRFMLLHILHQIYSIIWQKMAGKFSLRGKLYASKQEKHSPFGWALPMLETGMTTAIANKAAQVVCRNLFNSMVDEEIHQKRASFSIPDHLTKSWKLSDIVNEILAEDESI